MSTEAVATTPLRTDHASRAECTYFGAAGRQLFGWYHPAAGATCGVVICSPIGDESTGWHRAARHWAEGLASAGIAALRFDYDGTGDSLGDMADRDRVRAWIDSVGDASDFLRRTAGVQHLVLAGLRLGATLAVASTIERGRVDGLVLWAPFTTGKAWLREGRAFTRLMAPALSPASDARATHEQFGGLALAVSTVAELETLDPLQGSPRLALPVLLVPRDPGASDAALRERLAKAGAIVEREVLDGYASVVTDAHQGRVPLEIIQGSVAWIGRHFARTGATASSNARPNLQRTDRAAGGSRTATVDELTERALRIGEQQLFGILTSSLSASRRRTGILLVNSGAVYRVGPNRLYVTLARAWAKLGYTVLRMDLGGLGDSPAPGMADENLPYPEHATRDVAAGMAALRDAGAERVVVAGLCSGAHTTFHAALELEGLDGAIIINPIVFYWKPSDPLDVGAWQTYVESRHYKEAARHWNAWRKLLSGRVNLLHVTRIARQRTREVIRAKAAALRRRFVSSSPVENAPHDLGKIAARGTDVLLLFSEGDPGHDFLMLNYAGDVRRLRRRPGFTLCVIPDADHTFTAVDARERARAVLTEHLLARHP